MKKGLIVLVVVILVLIGIVSWVIGIYNNFVTLEEGVNNKWAQVETQYQRRFDLIPNLVETVKGSANFQQDTFTEVTAARSAWAQAKEAGDISGEMEAASSFDSALSRLLVTVESYPDLDTEAFKGMMSELEGTENRIAVARKDYNDSVKVYNIAVRKFPGMFFAGIFGFDQKPTFEAKQGAEDAPKVDFSN